MLKKLKKQTKTTTKSVHENQIWLSKGISKTDSPRLDQLANIFFLPHPAFFFFLSLEHFFFFNEQHQIASKYASGFLLLLFKDSQIDFYGTFFPS